MASHVDQSIETLAILIKRWLLLKVRIFSKKMRQIFAPFILLRVEETYFEKQ